MGNPLTFHVDHVGSLLRPKGLLEARDRLLGAQGTDTNMDAHDNAELREIENGYIDEVVALQQEAGLGVVTDGEFRRRSWWSDFALSLKGTSVTYDGTSPLTFINAEGDTRPTPAIRIDDRIAWDSSVMAEPFRYLKSVAKVTPKVSIPGPPIIHFMRDGDIRKDIYPDLDALWEDLVVAYRAEIKTLADAGCRHLQLDEVMLPFLCDPRHREVSIARGEDPDWLIGKFTEITNAALKGRPDDMTVTMHMCRGNLSAYWGAEGGYGPIAEAAFNGLDVDGFLLEYDTPRAGDFEPLRHLPEGKTALLGLMSTKETALESTDDLRRRVDEAAKIIPLDRLGLCPQCGFSTNVFGTHFTIDDE